MRQSFTLISPRVRVNAARAIGEAPDGYRVTISAPGRSGDQSAMFHAICGDISKSGREFLGEPRPLWVWKVLLISAHATATGDGSDVVDGLEGEIVNIRESSADMSVARMASLITYCLAYCDTNGIALTETIKGGFYDDR
tara:strand:- start:5375 stop:5794 length:420 start_codon:yes stop_codon:yes gene_type:complete